MDFYRIKERSTKGGNIEVYPDFKVGRSKDLMVRGRSFYAVWDEKQQMWSTDEYDVQRLVDEDLYEYANVLKTKTGDRVNVMAMGNFSSRTWTTFQSFVQNLSDNSQQLDTNVTFSNTPVSKKSYISMKLDYPLEEGSIESYDKLMSTLYDDEARHKLEWAVGAVITGDSKNIQKFLVLYGAQGTGKSTFLNIIQMLFPGYYVAFEAATLTKNNNAFATEVFKSNPLLAIQHDGDLSRIEDNSRLNSIVSHEEMTMNEKYKASYTSRINSLLFMGTNKAVKITDAKSGLLRRLIDVTPTGNTVPPKEYDVLYNQMKFEKGAIAYHCEQVFRSAGKNYYASYIPMDMIYQTDVFFNFVEDSYNTFSMSEGITLSQAYDIYKVYSEQSMLEYKLTRHKFREELKNYFKTFHQVTRIDGKQVRSYYEGFLAEKFDYVNVSSFKKEDHISVVLDQSVSILDEILKDSPAQLASQYGTPRVDWSINNKSLKDIDTSLEHFVQPPINHIVIDFDKKDDSGKKSAVLNLIAAAKFPPTYTEHSRGGAGVHLHYYYEGDPLLLDTHYADDVEIKVFKGNSSLRRRVSLCNDTPIATITTGLPIKEDKVINTNVLQTEVGLRKLIERNLRKEIHPGTKPSVDFIYTILEDAYAQGMAYDVSNMKRRLISFASKSTNHAPYCLKKVLNMRLESEQETSPLQEVEHDKPIVIYDVEVFKNYVLVGYKHLGETEVTVIVNPTPAEYAILLEMRSVGFNNRGYDNHILYAGYLGWDIDKIYNLSKSIVTNQKHATFREAYNVGHADIYDFSSKKQSLKKWMNELGILHKELDHPWDEPLPEIKLQEAIDYLKNDVVASEEVFNHLVADYTARTILAELSGLPVIATTRQHASKIVFEGDATGRKDSPHKAQFIYTDLSEIFPGYTHGYGKSQYRGEDPSNGGRVFSKPGFYENVAVLDVESMHPTSAIEMKIFGERYTSNLAALKQARLDIKHNHIEKIRDMFNGKLVKYLQDPAMLKALSNAFKLIINSIYGYTAATFDNDFLDPRNVDNIVAKRGALFMIDLQFAVEEMGYTVAHIKTDSIKIPNADDLVIEFVKSFAQKYGYNMEHESTYDRMCLVNDAVYIALENGTWTAVGAQFAHPYVFKKLFSKEPITFNDLTETRSVKSTMYLDYNEYLPDGDSSLQFIGKTGKFTPILPGNDAGELIRIQDDKRHAVSGTKGYRWFEAYDVKMLGKFDHINVQYFEDLSDAAVANIEKFVPYSQLVGEALPELKSSDWLNEIEVISDPWSNIIDDNNNPKDLTLTKNEKENTHV